MMRILLMLILSWGAISAQAAPLPNHRLYVTLEPEEHTLQAEDSITMPRGFAGALFFSLHKNLDPSSIDAEITPANRPGMQSWMKRYKAVPRSGHSSFTVRYSGQIFQPPQQEAQEARNFAATPGIISEDGVMLEGDSGWYPQIEFEGSDGMLTFSLEVKQPRHWYAVSQGARISPRGANITWKELQPQQEIYLVAGPLREFTQRAAKTVVYLHNNDEAEASRYINAATRYLALYEQLIGPYPYDKFALVENFWETGYSMPSFTLMGEKVLRLPFIIDSSFPHEILHNWWGNGVYVDYSQGNWSEGLTAYMADHLLQEQMGAGVDYRRAMLQKYADFVSSGNDFPLAKFTSRNSASSEAVGYGKSMMLFHMLRKELGEDRFILALQNLFSTRKFKKTSFAEVEQFFSQSSGKNLKPFFEQWVQRPGAPQLQITSVQAQPTADGGYDLNVGLEQSQLGAAYALNVPVAITLAGNEEAFMTSINMTAKQGTYLIPLRAQPLRIDIDPEFDVFRRVGNEEAPPAFSRLLGADKLTLVLPRHAAETLRSAYLSAAHAWQQPAARSIQVVWDDEIDQLPTEGAVWLFGTENRFRDEFQSALAADAKFGATDMEVGKAKFSFATKAFVLAAQGKNTPLGWLSVPEPEVLPPLVRKIPHYAKFSYAVFGKAQEEEPALKPMGPRWGRFPLPEEMTQAPQALGLNNLAKGSWTANTSALTRLVPEANGGSRNVPRGKLPRRYSLIR